MKMSLSRWIGILGIFLLINYFPVTGSDAPLSHPQEDSSQIRRFNELRMDEARGSPEYDYSLKRGSGTSIWQRIKAWLGVFLRKLFSSRNTGMVIQIILYALIVGTAIFSMLKFLNANPASILGKSPSQNLAYKVSNENIHEIDFEKEIDIAVENHDYRLATRLFYLQSLKLLADLELIQWLPSKTNAEYFYELKSGLMRNSFSSLGHMFEYAWYGGFTIDKNIMERARNCYLDIKTRSQTGEI